MGASMTGVIEYLDDAAGHYLRPDLYPEIKDSWHNGWISSFVFETGKEYEFFCAIAGTRCDKHAKPLIEPRGFPKETSILVDHMRAQHDFLEQLCGWLCWSEIQASIAHSKIDQSRFGPRICMPLIVMDTLQQRLGDKSVRLIFDIDGG